jgi:hypothetical protein
MILASTVYSAVIDLIRADKRGLSLSEDEYNRLSTTVNERVYAKMYGEFETSTDNSYTMGTFKVLNHAIALGGAACSLPADVYDIIGKPRISDAGGVTRRCDLVTQLELDERTDDYLTQPSETYPCYVLGELDVTDNLILHVYPITIAGNIYIDYLRVANTPYLDYYMNDATFGRTYLAEGAVNVNVPSGYTYRDKTTGGVAVFVNSQTVNWEYSDSELPLILSIFCQLIGITLPDAGLIQVGNVEEQKNF